MPNACVCFCPAFPSQCCLSSFFFFLQKRPRCCKRQRCTFILPLPVFWRKVELSRVSCHAERVCTLLHAQNMLKGVRLHSSSGLWGCWLSSTAGIWWFCGLSVRGSPRMGRGAWAGSSGIQRQRRHGDSLLLLWLSWKYLGSWIFGFRGDLLQNAVWHSHCGHLQLSGSPKEQWYLGK